MPGVLGVTERTGTRGSRAALAVVTIALVALVVVPMAAERYTRPLFDELRSLTAPAQQLLTRIHVTLALEGSAVRDFAETHSPALAARYRDAAAGDSAAQARLGEIVARLGPVVRARYAVLREANGRWRVAADAALASPGARDSPERREQAYQDVLIAAARLGEALDAAVQSRRARIREAVRLQRRTSVVLSVLGLLALGAVASLARRLRAAAAEARERRRAVERLMESKARLMRGISHDLKNPLNAIAGFAALLADGIGGDLTAQQRKSVQRIRAGVASVLALVDDLLELSRADVGQLRVAFRPTDLRSVVLDAVEEHRAAAQARGHALEAGVPDELPELETDPTRVRQVLSNLLSNAIKYTPPGGHVRIDAEVRAGGESPERRPAIGIHVTDTGPGIPESQLEAVFDEFTRFDRTGQVGSGLGLAIARRVARLLGGDLTAESAVGRGSRFTLWVPLRPLAERRLGERRLAPDVRAMAPR